MPLDRLRQRSLGRWGLVTALILCAACQTARAQGVTMGGGQEDEARQKAAAQEKASRYFSQGQALMEKGDVARAKSKFKAAIGLVGLDGVGQSAWNQLLAIHNQGMQELEHAQQLFKEEKYVEALDVANRARNMYANIFGGLKVPNSFPNVSRQAKALIAAMQKHPQAQAAIQEHAAKKRLKRIAALERKVRKDKTAYYDLYKAHMAVAKQYPDSPSGKASAAEAARLTSDKKIAKAIEAERDRRDIAAALSRVEDLEKTGRLREAEEELKALMSRFPGKSRTDLKAMSIKKRASKPAKKKG